MTILNVITHIWMELRFPKLTFISYVDNLELLGCSADKITEGTKLGQFVNLFDMELDVPKTYYWLTSSLERKELRSNDVDTCEHVRDLGVICSM